jgi:isopentenyl diphosphate isomerase/L-lactate dehydrogenase-like FMN-dependent dehydrogenase
MNIDKKFPCVADMEAAALPRLPKFMRDYLSGGLGNGVGVRKNRTTLDDVELMPRYMSDLEQPDYTCSLLGKTYDAPFGVAPIGLGGLIWANAERILSAAALQHNIPYCLSTVAIITLESAQEISGENTWFQLYTPRDPAVREDLIDRCERAGYETLVVTVDVPFGTRREHDIRNGMSVPPSPNLQTLWQMVTHPNWSLRMAAAGVPKFANLAPYYDAQTLKNRRSEITKSTRFIKDRMGVHITKDVIGEIRGQWKGNLLVKGVLDPDESVAYLDAGVDGLIVSNHGGRQLDASPSAVSVLPVIRDRVGPDATVLADGGIRSGLDIARMLALGADFVLLGRPFLFALAAIGSRGGDHVMHILKAELRTTMGQLGCTTLADFPSRLFTSS